MRETIFSLSPGRKRRETVRKREMAGKNNVSGAAGVDD